MTKKTDLEPDREELNKNILCLDVCKQSTQTLKKITPHLILSVLRERKHYIHHSDRLWEKQ